VKRETFRVSRTYLFCTSLAFETALV
jgi:hypothetical protein